MYLLCRGRWEAILFLRSGMRTYSGSASGKETEPNVCSTLTNSQSNNNHITREVWSVYEFICNFNQKWNAARTRIFLRNLAKRTPYTVADSNSEHQSDRGFFATGLLWWTVKYIYGWKTVHAVISTKLQSRLR